jgi:hypothetical protein
MTTSAQIEANRKNALVSTGPKTPAGKARAGQNALRHGLGTLLPVLPGERAEDWEAHRDGILASLAPVGALEESLAHRVALCLWRLGRVAAYEMAVTAVGLAEVPEDARRETILSEDGEDSSRLEKIREEIAEKRETLSLWDGTLRLLEQLPDLEDGAPVRGDDANGALEDISEELPGSENDYFELEDKRFLSGLGIPEDELHAAYEWDGWTAGMVRQAIAQMAAKFKTSPEKMLAKALKARHAIQEESRAEVRRLEGQARDLRRRLKAHEDRLRQKRMLPSGDLLQKVTRYEAHLSRQLYQALHELQRLQAARAGQPVPPPAALDVALDAGERAAATLEAVAGD